ncbi:hypothetical protein WJX72_001631 [[Myrmecia] bisecta]|uniref:Phosphoglycerate mutase n=1 Tax=[Myrmecia] bisecta TaxID=41462 RepID=A0AAW1R4M1_9CHLO
MQLLATLRHGLRQDEVDPGWSDTAGRPWDPPLSEQGWQQARDVADKLRDFGIGWVVVSPFLRCLQTARAIVEELRTPVKWEVNCALGEVMSQRYLSGLGRALPSGRVADWFWQGKSLQEGVSEELGTCDFDMAQSGFVEPPESIEQTHTRYARALQEVADRHASDNVLIVSHGEAVRRSVTFVLPWAQVYEVQHCGYTGLQREQDADGDWDEWHLLDQSKVSGVAWTEHTTVCANPTYGFILPQTS